MCVGLPRRAQHPEPARQARHDVAQLRRLPHGRLQGLREAASTAARWSKTTTRTCRPAPTATRTIRCSSPAREVPAELARDLRPLPRQRALMSKYGISTTVAQTYLVGFPRRHRVALAQPVGSRSSRWSSPATTATACTTSRRRSSRAPEAMKATVTAACSKCHKDAAPTFPAAWLSHYPPSPRHAPLVWARAVVLHDLHSVRGHRPDPAPAAARLPDVGGPMRGDAGHGD